MTAPITPDSLCPFCAPGTDKVIYESTLVIGMWDGFPVSAGHILLVPRRHVASWFDATDEEKLALVQAMDWAKAMLDQRFAPHGYNIGVNAGRAAGQTIFHLHVHVIPRYEGDVPDPRGGVRHVIPAKGNYLLGATPMAVPPATTAGLLLTTGGTADPLLPQLKLQLAAATHVDIAVAFVMKSGVELLRSAMTETLSRSGHVRLLTGDYLDATDPVALLQLLDLSPGSGSIARRVYQTTAAWASGAALPTAFHPKAYIFRHADGTGTAFVGSSNMSRTALQDGVEWNYRIVESRDEEGFGEIRRAFDALFHDSATTTLTNEWVEAYKARRAVRPLAQLPDTPAAPAAEPLNIPDPHSIQQDALVALKASRRDGATAGLVVLATGLGKTWLSAFDSREFKRVLFVAHREEILDQAMQTYRRIRPEDYLGHYTGDEKHPNANVLFASIQTLSRQAHLDRFPDDHFDYVVIDEFHHASAATYRRLLQHFQPQYLLGLTATPERSDGADLLELCGGNLVFRCDLGQGITRDLLCPFDYFGVPDEVDYSNIPWRSRRFDKEALTTAVATTSRAENALEQLNRRGGRRALAFCVSQRHADFMADFLRRHGKRAAAVHSGPTSDPRTLSLERLQAGELDVVCAVDMFNEGVDLPDLDTVMMLRPTESKILWLQQFGRGLRKASPDKRLAVIDYIGNHRTFLLKPQTLFNLSPGDQNIQNLIEQYQAGTAEIPPGCSVTYDLAAIDILKGLLRSTASSSEALRIYVQDFVDVHGVRPTALEAYRDGYSPRSVRANFGSWFGFLRTLKVLAPDHERAAAEAAAFLDALEVTRMTRSFKMVTLLAMLNRDAFPGSIRLDDLVAGVRQVAMRQADVFADFGSAIATDLSLRAHLKENPVKAWTSGADHGGQPFFTVDAGVFASTMDVPAQSRSALQELTRELVEWRLAEYLARPEVAEGSYLIKVNQANGNPILMPLNRESHPGLPEGWTDFSADGKPYRGHFVKIALNLAERQGIEGNELPALLRGWFGPDAGAPGTRHQVLLTKAVDGWTLAPTGIGVVSPVLWKSYSREQIPRLFGLEFIKSVWQQGFVRRDNRTFLLVTLDKATAADQHKYEDRFLSPAELEWQSQNRTTQASEGGKSIRDHLPLGIEVLLFVRHRSKNKDRKAAPFVYCGPVDFVDWSGNKPITVKWRLRQEVPERLRDDFRVARE